MERDRVLEQRIALFKWIEPHYLDIPEGSGREGFLMFAQQGWLPVCTYSLKMTYVQLVSRAENHQSC